MAEIFEIELKSLLSKEKYDELLNELPRSHRLINTETMHTTRFRPGDVRLRHSDSRFELVSKSGDASMMSRKEVKLDLKSKQELDKMSMILEMLDFKADPSWIKHKHEFEYEYKGFTYIICLQHIENFAYILEVEFLSDEDVANVHEPNIKEIMEELECEAIKPGDFIKSINKYIADNK